MTTLLAAQASSGLSGAYLAVQVVTSQNFVALTDNCLIKRILSSARTANGQVYVYYADDAAGTNARIIYHLGFPSAYVQQDIRDLSLFVPFGKYILTYGVGSVHDTTFTVELNSTQLNRTATASNVTTYAPVKSGGVSIQGPIKLKRVISMNTTANSVGYLYLADDISGSNATVLRGYSGSSLYSVTDQAEDCMSIPSGKYLLTRAEVGSMSFAVTVGI